MTNDKRSKKFIDRGTQLLIGGQIVLHSILLVGLLALFLFADPFVTMFSSYSAEDHLAIAKELILLNSPKWPLFVLLALFTGAVSTIFSHQIVGPIYRANSVLEELARRNLAVSARFRRTDYFKELESHLNTVIGQWRGDMETIAQNQKKAESLVKDLRANPGNSAKLQELESVVAGITQTVRSYEGLERLS